ncbi:MAG: hypothetical protein IKN91_06375 [Paludibacteraceae bacterium]|nr:hypothetical protein [Paludibacteraceae bacterium]
MRQLQQQLAIILLTCSLLSVNLYVEAASRTENAEAGVNVGVNSPSVSQPALSQPSYGNGLQGGNSILNRRTTPIRSSRYVSPTQQSGGSVGGTTVFNFRQSAGRLSGGGSGSGGGSMSSGMGLGGSSRGGYGSIGSGGGATGVAVPSMGTTTFGNNHTQSGPRRVSDDDDPGEPGVEEPLGNGILVLLAIALAFSAKKRKEKNI